MDDAAREGGAERWRERLIAALAAGATDTHRDDPATVSDLCAAGVLIPVVAAPAPFVYFTERSSALRHHAGQISFPGGRVESADDSIQAAALRETWEEIGLDRGSIEVLGRLPVYRTGTGFEITPFVGWVEPSAAINADAGEVARVFRVPLTHALDHHRFHRHTVTRRGREYEVYSIDYAGDHIWGATAGMLYGLVRQLARAEHRVIGEPPPAGDYVGG